MLECETCPRGFGSYQALYQHMNAKNHWAKRYKCETCDEVFLDGDDCNEHMDEYDHWSYNFECETCTGAFRTQEDCEIHMNKKNHWTRDYECDGCDARFRTQQECKKHMYAEDHWMRNRCNECDRGFESKGHLNQHLHGHAHNANSIKCPFCGKGYTTASGLTYHLESSSCPQAPGLNRQTIFNGVRKLDRQGVITNNLLKWKDDHEYIATSSSWNGDCFECYLCHNEFDTLRALNQHLSSPKHKQDIYHCFGRHCNKQVKTLAQLFQHLESENCGAIKFQSLQRDAKAILTGRPGQKLLVNTK